jgi:thioesterase domain-containing protein
MGRERPFYALQPRSSMQEAAVAGTIEQMALADLEELRRVQPAGPYLLIGWSMGGLIAYEMACLLVDAGESVSLLALLDAGVPDVDESPRDAIDLVVELASQHLDIDPRELGDVEGEARFEAVLALAQRSGKLAHEVDMRWVRWLAEGYRLSTEAVQKYRPRPYDGHLTLIRAAEHRHRTTDDTMGWAALASGGVDVHWVPGAHYNIVHQPHVLAVAEALRACLSVEQQPAPAAVDVA